MTTNSSHPTPKGRILFGTTVGLSARSFLRGQLTWFRKQGWDVLLVSTPDADASYTARSEGIRLLGIEMQREIALLSDLRAAKAWLRTIRLSKPDAVNIGTPKASLLGMVASWVARVPRRIYTVRGLRLEGSSGLMAKLLWLMERLTLALATDIIAVSPSLGDELVRHNLISADKIWIIGEGSSNGVDAYAIQKRVAEVGRPSALRAVGMDSSNFVVCFVGRLTESKGLTTLMRAMNDPRLDPVVRLLIIGGEIGQESGLSDEFDSERIHVVPWTNDVWGYLSAVDTLCLPTEREGFPNVVLESAAAGIPAITTRSTGAVDSVIDGETGFLIDVGDASTLVERLNLMVRDRRLTQRLGKQAKKRAERRFCPLLIWQGIEAIIEARTDAAEIQRLDEYRK